MQLFVRSIDGKTISLKEKHDAHVSDLKHHVNQYFGINSPCRLIYGGKELESSKQLSEYNLRDQSTVQLAGSLCGGIIEPNGNKIHEHRCYARLPPRAENCRKRKCGHSSDLRMKKVPR